jgi:uncharacterized protein with FMN-binding domain
MKATPLLVLAGTVAGVIGVLSFHTRPVTTVAQTGGTPSPSASPSASHTAAAGTVRSAVGPDENFGYGMLDVKVTVTGSRITDVSVPELQTAEPTSQQISEQAIALLRPEVLSAQSGRIDAVSGASYTSAAYLQSLQGALDQLHIKGSPG